MVQSVFVDGTSVNKTSVNTVIDMKYLFLFFFDIVLIMLQAAKADEALLCFQQTARQEKRNQIQTNLLSAIALVESGRHFQEYPTGIPWPWTVTAQGKGVFYPSKEQAVQAVKDLQKQGIENIDVGCMQINLKYHPEAFNNVEDALDPFYNVSYAASFLKRNYQETNSWGQAATQYHSKTPHKAFKYEDKLLEAWKRLSEYGNPATPDIVSQTKDVSGESPQKIKALSGKEKKETRMENQSEHRKKAALWRKKKLEEYQTKRKKINQNSTVY